MGKINAGASHKTHHFIERDTVRGRGDRATTFAPGERVVVRPMPGIPNTYAGRLGEVVEAIAVEGEPAYRVQLDFYAPDEADAPMAFFTAELRHTRLPKISAAG